MDIVFVIDESGSVTPTEFNSFKQFMKDLINSWNISPGAVQVGIVMFSSSSRTIIAINNNKPNLINAINYVSQYGGARCIGCGIDRATDLFQTAGARTALSRLAIVVTKGPNDRPIPNPRQFLIDAVNELEGIGGTLFAVGYGPDPNQDELESIGSDIPDIQTIFYSLDAPLISSTIDSLYPCETHYMNLQAGWSMISLPVEPADARLGILFPDYKAAFRFTTRYELLAANDALEWGKGYWIYLSETHAYTITGRPMESVTIPDCPSGWSMIGGCTYPVKPSAHSGTIRAVFKFSNRYVILDADDALQPGKGYWINLSQETSLTLE